MIFLKIFQSLSKIWRLKKRFSEFYKNGTFILPESYQVGERFEYKSGPTRSFYKNIHVVAQFIPLRKVLKKNF